MACRSIAGLRCAALLAGLGGMLALAGCSGPTSPEAAATPSDIEIARSRLEAHVRVLAHDSMCGRLAGTDDERGAAAYIADQFAAAGLAPAGDDGWYQLVLAGSLPRGIPFVSPSCTSQPTSLSQNVIGAVTGRGSLAAQWVVLGAHYDHLGWDGTGGLTRVFNGADDNASGTAIVLEVARALAAWLAAHPEASANHRSVMFHAYGAEETGLAGSRQYASAPTVPAGAIRAMINLDMVGRLREQTLIVAGAGTAAGWSPLLLGARPGGLEFTFDDGSLQRSDQWNFIGLLGVPGLHLFTGTHADYHTPDDDPPLLNYGGMQTIAQLTLALLWELMTTEDVLTGPSPLATRNP